MQNPFRRFLERGSSPEPLSEPVSISFGKAVQFRAEAAARRDKEAQPKKKHYDKADKETAAEDESTIETLALIQKLQELVGRKQVLAFVGVIEVKNEEIRSFVKQTAEAELEERLLEVLNNIQSDNTNINREVVAKGIKDSVILYELEAATQVEEMFDALKSKIYYHQDLPNREAVQETINELIAHFGKMAVSDAVNTYRNNMHRLIALKIQEMVYKVSLKDLEDI